MVDRILLLEKGVTHVGKVKTNVFPMTSKYYFHYRKSKFLGEKPAAKVAQRQYQMSLET